MDVKFGNVLACRTARSGKPEHHRIIDRLAGGVVEQPTACLARRRQLAGERHQNFTGLSTRDPHHRDRTRRPAGRQCEDSLVSWMHGLFVRLPAKTQTSVRRRIGQICCANPAADSYVALQ
jgi:hypothetical protein